MDDEYEWDWSNPSEAYEGAQVLKDDWEVETEGVCDMAELLMAAKGLTPEQSAYITKEVCERVGYEPTAVRFIDLGEGRCGDQFASYEQEEGDEVWGRQESGIILAPRYAAGGGWVFYRNGHWYLVELAEMVPLMTKRERRRVEIIRALCQSLSDTPNITKKQHAKWMRDLARACGYLKITSVRRSTSEEIASGKTRHGFTITGI